MNTPRSAIAAFRFLVPLLAAAFAPPALSAVPESARLTGGLLGQDYAGLDAAYIRNRAGGPTVMHRYGFYASRPMPERPNLDGIFRYNYTSGSTLGMDGRQHDFSIGAAGFTRQGDVAPFLEGNVGWAWARAGAMRENSFLYSVRAGVELLLSPQIAITPSVSYREARQFGHQWLFGTRLGYRLNEGWGATLHVQFDEDHSVETAVGVHRRF